MQKPTPPDQHADNLQEKGTPASDMQAEDTGTAQSGNERSGNESSGSERAAQGDAAMKQTSKTGSERGSER